MSREIRMVPPDWQHPVIWEKDWKTERPRLRFRPLLDDDFTSRAADWDEEAAQWEKGFKKSYNIDGEKWGPKDATDTSSFDEYHGKRPRAEDYMPTFPINTATHMMMYETTSEGTPISPAFETPEELAQWLANNNASAFGGETATYDQWLSACRRGWAPSAITDQKGFRSGVAALSDNQASIV